MRCPSSVCALLAASLFLSACGHLTLNSPDDLGRLPVSQGVNMGSVVAPTPWQYLGSTESTHEFRYYYHRGNRMRDVEVSVPHASAVLDFSQRPVNSAPQWTTLDTSQEQLHFSPYVQLPSQRMRLKDLFPAGHPATGEMPPQQAQ